MRDYTWMQLSRYSMAVLACLTSWDIVGDIVYDRHIFFVWDYAMFCYSGVFLYLTNTKYKNRMLVESYRTLIKREIYNKPGISKEATDKLLEKLDEI